MQAWDIEACEPHVADNDNLETFLWISEPMSKLFAALLIAYVLLPLNWIRSRACHHDLE